jgi:hypothetical protein
MGRKERRMNAFNTHAADCPWCLGHAYCSTGEELLAREQGTADDCWAEHSAGQFADRVLAGLR